MATSYRRFIYELTAGVDFLRDGLGRLYAGTLGTVVDALVEGARQSFVQGLPGHPEQIEDSLNQNGADRSLFRFRGETLVSWRGRIQNAWTYHEQAGTAIQVLRAVNEFGTIVFSATWNPALIFLTEDRWARFTVWLNSGVVPWAPAEIYDSGVVYDAPNLMYDLSGATTEDVSTLSAVIRKWAPLRSKGQALVVLSGLAYGQPGLVYGAGAVLSAGSTARIGA